MRNRFWAVFLFSAIAFAQPEPAPPQFRIGDAAKPVRYAVELKLAPAEETFSGKVAIDLDVRRPSTVLWLNADSLTIENASLAAGGATLAANPLAGKKKGYVGFQFDTPVPAGKATLHIAYKGQVNSRSSDGVFRNQDLDNWYIFTQFESIQAREAFPCFDEPGYKTPWQITLIVRKDQSAFSNAPEIGETDAGDGWKAVKFAETKPLSSYQVAFVTGPFEVLDAGKVGRKHAPLRIIVPKGRAAEAKWAVESTGPILAWLENYFNVPFPYEKLDSVSVPLFRGAMENPGLITYGQSFMLAKPENDYVNRRRGYASTAAHEMAHLWFGDLVTMAWWDDLWLNEGFATWMAGKAIAEWKPEWDYATSNAASRLNAMNSDSLITARKIRQPVNNESDIANAFDGITYGKAGAVIRMFEQYVGPETFRKGVKAYLDAHAYGNATAADFLAAVSSAAGRDIAPAFSSFLDQPGVPQVAVELKCEQGKPPALALTQKRYLPLGSPRPGPQTWQIPVCFAYGSGKSTQHECAMFDGTAAEVPIKTAKACPDWILLNDHYNGYYRSQYKGGLLNGVLSEPKRRTAAERLGLLRDAYALVRSGDVPYAEALALAPRFANDPNRQVVSTTASIADSIDEHLVPDELRPNYVRFVEQTYGARARELGWTSKPGEDDDTKLLRQSVVGLAAAAGEDKALREQAARLARQWLDDRKAVQPEMAGLVLAIAARDGGRDLWERYLAEAKKTNDEHERGILLGAMGSFKDPEIIKSNFELLASKQFDMRQSFGLLFAPLQHRETRDLPYQYVTANYDAVAASMPSAMGFDFKSRLPLVGRGFCSEDKRAEVEAFFKDRMQKVTGGPRLLAQTLESIRQCAAMRSAQQAGVADFLEKY